MKISSLLIFLILLVWPFDCLDQCSDECIETEAPEINFGFMLGGDITFETSSGDNIAAQHDEFIIDVYKVYCDGRLRGNFRTEFTIDTDGVLVNKSLGYMSFKMDNTMDYMKIILRIDEPNKTNSFIDFAGPLAIWYDELKSYDGGNAYVHFTLTFLEGYENSVLYTINWQSFDFANSKSCTRV